MLDINTINEIKDFLEKCERVTYVEDTRDGLICIFEGMQFDVDFKNNTYIQSRWNLCGEATNLIGHLKYLLDNIEFCETFGVLSKEAYFDLIFNRMGW